MTAMYKPKQLTREIGVKQSLLLWFLSIWFLLAGVAFAIEDRPSVVTYVDGGGPPANIQFCRGEQWPPRR